MSTCIYPLRLQIDASDNFYISGYYDASANFGSGVILPAATGNGAFLSKFTSNGDIIWAKSIDSVSNYDQINKLLLTSNSLYLLGTFGDTITLGPGVVLPGAVGQSDIFLAKYDLSGNAVWASSFGSTNFDSAYGLALDSSNNIYISGQYGDGPVSLGSGLQLPITQGAYDGYFIKYNSSGSPIWYKTLGSANVDTLNYISIYNNVFYLSSGYSDTTIFGNLTFTSNSGSTDSSIFKIE
jgi:hypothetical protein